MNTVRLLSALLLAFLPGSLSGSLLGENPQEPGAAPFVCPPCGAECHFVTHASAGSCGVCGMALVSLASVPQVGVLLHPRAALTSTLLVLGLFGSSEVARAFGVADTTEPLRLGDSIEVRPQFSYAESPPLDVLVVPEAYGSWEDPLLLEWVQERAQAARYVLAIGLGSVTLAEGGFLEGEHVPATAFLAQRGAKLTTKVVFDEKLRWRRVGKFFLARDAEAAVDASLTIVRELGGEERARRAAAQLGHPWPPADSAGQAPAAK